MEPHRQRGVKRVLALLSLSLCAHLHPAGAQHTHRMAVRSVTTRNSSYKPTSTQGNVTATSKNITEEHLSNIDLLDFIATEDLMKDQRPSSRWRIPCLKNMVVFGDAYSDTGNLFVLSDERYPVSPPYHDGRFTNGAVWAERAANSLGLSLSSHAYAGSTTHRIPNATQPDFRLNPLRSDPYAIVPPPMDEVVKKYIKEGNVDDNTLYVVWGSVSDFFLTDFTVSPLGSVQAIMQSVGLLLQAGAQHIAVMTVAPNPRMVPKDNITLNITNIALEASVTSLADALQHDGILFFDMATTLTTVPSRYPNTFTDIHSPCYDYTLALNQSTFTICDRPLQYMWWDRKNPSATTHALMARDFVRRALGITSASSYRSTCKLAPTKPIVNIKPATVELRGRPRE